MPFTLKGRISGGLAVIMAIGIVSMLIVSAGLYNLHRTMHELSDVKEPTAAAAYQMEINLWGQGMSVLRYLQRRDPQERDRAIKNEADFERFYAQYARFANAPEDRAVLWRLRDEYDRFRNLGTSMMMTRDRQDALHAASRNSCRGESRCEDEKAGALTETDQLESRLQADGRTFAALRDRLDEMLSNQIQAAALQDLAAPRLAADRATRTVIVLATMLMPLFIVAIAVVSAVSEARLRRVNVELSRQTADRERVEEDRHRLQVALRRSEVLSALGSIVAGVSHEVRNPLFGISSTVDALEARLKRDKTAGKYERHVEVLRGELDRLSRLMHDLIEYGKPQSLDIADHSIADAVNASVEACWSIAVPTGVMIVTSIAPGVEAWPMDRARIDQVLRNLLENAIQHSHGRTVRMDVRRISRSGAEYLQIQVRDHGPGFDPTQLGHVFEPFFTRRSGGTGLGLSIVERVVDAHGGVVRAANCPQGGAEITVELPQTGHSSSEVAGAA